MYTDILIQDVNVTELQAHYAILVEMQKEARLTATEFAGIDGMVELSGRMLFLAEGVKL